MNEFTPTDPELEEVVLDLPDSGVTVSNFTEYEFNSNFLTPTDGFSFTIGTDRLTDKMRKAIAPGAAVSLSLAGWVQATGYIDSVEVSASREGGSVWRIEGRDRLGHVIDACADPTKPFKEGQTLHDALVSLFSPFGWSKESQFVIDNDANRSLKAGGVRGEKKKSGAKGHSKRALKQYKLHQLRPYPREGVFEFASRIAQRQGLWIWASADGDKIIVDRPAFDEDPLYRLDRTASGTTNVLDGSVRFDQSDQPTIIVADGYSGGGDFGRSKVKALMVNTAVYTEDPAFLEPFKTYKDARQVLGYAFATPVRMPRNRTLYLHDEQSQTLDHLENYVRREMSLLQRKALQVHYTVQGHGQSTPNGLAIWSVDTIVEVNDELANMHENLFVLGRTFVKSRGGGTTTRLELIRQHTIEFGEPEREAPAGPKYQEQAIAADEADDDDE